MAILEVDQLSVQFSTPEGLMTAVHDVSFSLQKGETLAIVGESGAGKSQLVLAIMGLLPKNGSCTGHIRFQGQALLASSAGQMNQIRGQHIAMIFQDPMTCLNPYLKIVTQMTEVLIYHKQMSYQAAKLAVIEAMEAVKIPAAKERIMMYPHQFSGGMRQRVMIAMALLCRPAILIADEPTTALDTTIQAEMMTLLSELQNQYHMAIILITHDLGIVARLGDKVLIMYAGNVVERSDVATLFQDPQHPYTQGLLGALPRLDWDHQLPLKTIAGNPPTLGVRQPGCVFADRCPYVFDRCHREAPPLEEIRGHARACHLQQLDNFNE